MVKLSLFIGDMEVIIPCLSMSGEGAVREVVHCTLAGEGGLLGLHAVASAGDGVNWNNLLQEFSIPDRGSSRSIHSDLVLVIKA